MACLLGPGDAETAAAEIALMLLLTDHTLDYQAMNNAVAQALAEGGWHNQRTGKPITPDHTATILGDLRRRLRLLDLAAEKRLGQPLRLNDAGRHAAHAALRARALRPRTHPLT